MGFRAGNNTKYQIMTLSSGSYEVSELDARHPNKLFWGVTMRTTVTVHFNDGSVARDHNIRKIGLVEHEPHIDTSNRLGDSAYCILKNQDLRDAYIELFQEALDERNMRVRKDKRWTIDDYMDSVANDTRGKRQTKRVNGKRVINESARRGKQLEYEMTFAVGNTTRPCEGFPESLPRELQVIILARYAEEFEKANSSNFHVTQMVIHADESFHCKATGKDEYACIGLHIVYIPFADFKPDKKGRCSMKRQNSMNRALVGVLGENGEGANYQKFQEREKERLERITKEEWYKYCSKKGITEDIEIYHPVHDHEREGGLEKEDYADQQVQNEALEEVLRSYEESLDQMRRDFEKKIALIDEIQKDSARMNLETAQKNREADERMRHWQSAQSKQRKVYKEMKLKKEEMEKRQEELERRMIEVGEIEAELELKKTEIKTVLNRLNSLIQETEDVKERERLKEKVQETFQNGYQGNNTDFLIDFRQKKTWMPTKETSK